MTVDFGSMTPLQKKIWADAKLKDDLALSRFAKLFGLDEEGGGMTKRAEELARLYVHDKWEIEPVATAEMNLSRLLEQYGQEVREACAKKAEERFKTWNIYNDDGGIREMDLP